MTFISVIIPSFNAEHNLNICLTALMGQKPNEDFEIIVMDCSTTDKTMVICSKYGNVDFFYESKRFNPGMGRNLGAAKAKGDILVFIDADVVLDTNAIKEINAAFLQGYKIFGGALELYSNGNLEISSLLEHYYFNHESQKYRPISRRKNLSSALLICDRKIFLECGGFKDIPRMQDTELTERLAQGGIDLYLIPKVIGYQIQDSSLLKVLKKVYITGFNLYPIRYSEKSFYFKILLFLFLPLLSVLKILRIMYRNLRYNDLKGKVCCLLLTPLFFICALIWMFGLYKSMILQSGISKNR